VFNYYFVTGKNKDSGLYLYFLFLKYKNPFSKL